MAFLVFVFLPVAFYYIAWLFPPRNSEWYILPLIILILLVSMPIVYFFTHYINPCRIKVSKKGIHVSGSELFRRYPFSDLVSVKVSNVAPGRLLLSWQDHQGEILRGISGKVDVSLLTRIIEENSEVKVTIGEEP